MFPRSQRLVRSRCPRCTPCHVPSSSDHVISVQWSRDSQCFLSTSRDMTARLFTLDPVEGFRPKTFAGHQRVIVNSAPAEEENSKWIRTGVEDEAATSSDEEDFGSGWLGGRRGRYGRYDDDEPSYLANGRYLFVTFILREPRTDRNALPRPERTTSVLQL